MQALPSRADEEEAGDLTRRDRTASVVAARRDHAPPRLARSAPRTDAPSRAHGRAVPAAPSRRGKTADDVDEVVLVGGSTRIRRYVRETWRELFGASRSPSSTRTQVVALGAAVQAGILSGGATTCCSSTSCRCRSASRRWAAWSTRLIDRNTDDPGRAARDVHDRRRQPDGVDLHVLQGERELVDGLPEPGALRASRSRRCRPACRASRYVPDRRERHPERDGPRPADRASSSRSR